jgi:hypothetical protein
MDTIFISNFIAVPLCLYFSTIFNAHFLVTIPGLSLVSGVYITVVVEHDLVEDNSTRVEEG